MMRSSVQEKSLSGNKHEKEKFPMFRAQETKGETSLSFQRGTCKSLAQKGHNHMKAGVVFEVGKPPVYSEFKDPIPMDGEVCVTVTASALTHFTKVRAEGKHYSFT